VNLGSRSRRDIGVLMGFLVAALLLAGVVSYYASGDPDGLNKVAIDKQFASSEQPHDLDDSPLAGYATTGVDDERFSGGLAGVIGVAVTLVVAGGAALLIRRREPQETPPGATSGPSA